MDDARHVILKEIELTPRARFWQATMWFGEAGGRDNQKAWKMPRNKTAAPSKMDKMLHRRILPWTWFPVLDEIPSLNPTEYPGRSVLFTSGTSFWCCFIRNPPSSSSESGLICYRHRFDEPERSKVDTFTKDPTLTARHMIPRMNNNRRSTHSSHAPS